MSKASLLEFNVLDPLNKVKGIIIDPFVQAR